MAGRRCFSHRATGTVRDRLEPLLTYHPFTRLNALLEGIPPGGPPLSLALGEPQMAPPPMLADTLARHAADWGKYPLATGTAAFRQAVADWLGRRFALPAGLIDPHRHVIPAAGSREALFHIALATVPEAGRGRRPAVLMPNPFYHVYAGAAAVAGGEPVFLPARRETGFLPEPEAVPAALLGRTALAYVNSPSNPQGAVADPGYLQRWIRLGRRYGFVVAFDECYSEIWLDRPPPGALAAAAALGGDLAGILVFHSLSKRSGVPGLRSGFTAGDPVLLHRIAQLVNYGGVAPPLPVLAASAALWADEAHVEAGRARYRECFAVAERLLGPRFGARRPGGGFFLWLPVGDGEVAARRLWAAAGLRVLPGAYMARPDASGANPGQPYIRIALVHEPATLAAALARLAETLAAPAAMPGRPGDGDALMERRA